MIQEREVMLRLAGSLTREASREEVWSVQSPAIRRRRQTHRIAVQSLYTMFYTDRIYILCIFDRTWAYVLCISRLYILVQHQWCYTYYAGYRDQMYIQPQPHIIIPSHLFQPAFPMQLHAALYRVFCITSDHEACWGLYALISPLLSCMTCISQSKPMTSTTTKLVVHPLYFWNIYNYILVIYVYSVISCPLYFVKKDLVYIVSYSRQRTTVDLSG